VKIAFDHQIFNWQAYGGISRYYTNLALELLKQGQNVGVFAGVHRNNYLEVLPDGVVREIKLKKYPPRSARLFQAFNHYLVEYQVNHWQAELVHETYYSFMPEPKASVPRITTVYDMINELYPQMVPTKDNTTGWKRKTFERVEHIISISHSTKKDLMELFGIEESKISVIHLGFDLFFSEDVNKQEPKKQRPFLLYVGGRGAYKNFNGLIKAIANSPRLKKDFDVIAFGGGGFNRDELSFMSRLGFRYNQIRQLSGSDKILKALYHQASALVYPSLYEGFGLPPLEAMACSCPVISSNTSSMPEVIGNGGEYFNPSEIDEIIFAIEKVVYSTSRTEELYALGLERIKYFSWSKCATETTDIYKKIIG